MRVKLGPRDEERYAGVDSGEREYLTFVMQLGLGILTKRPRQVEALERVADAMTALGYYHDGLALDLRLAAILPRDPLVLYNLACSQALTGHLDDALDTLERAMEVGYRDARHMSRDQDLLNLHGHDRFLELLQHMDTKNKTGSVA